MFQTQPDTSHPLHLSSHLRRFAWLVAIALLVTSIGTEAHALGGLTSGPETFSTGYAGVWIDAPGASRIHSTSSLAAFTTLDLAHELDGFQLVDFEAAGFGAERRYVGLWHEAEPEAAGITDKSHLFVDLPLAELDWFITQQASAGYRLVDLEVYHDGALLAAALFHPHPGGSHATYGVDAAAFELLVAHWAAAGWVLVDVEPYRVDNTHYYAGVWHPQVVRSQPVVSLGGTWEDLVDDVGTYGNQRHLADLELIPSTQADSPWPVSSLLDAPSGAQHVMLPAVWTEVEAYHFGTGPDMGNRLMIDLEILWHGKGEIESSITVTHNGPMIPPDNPNG